MADRIAVINGGRILLVEEKATLMRRMGRKRMTIELQTPVAAIPESAGELRPDAHRGRAQPRIRLRHCRRTGTGIASLLRDLSGGRARAERRADAAGSRSRTSSSDW